MNVRKNKKSYSLSLEVAVCIIIIILLILGLIISKLIKMERAEENNIASNTIIKDSKDIEQLNENNIEIEYGVTKGFGLAYEVDYVCVKINSSGAIITYESHKNSNNNEIFSEIEGKIYQTIGGNNVITEFRKNEMKQFIENREKDMSKILDSLS